MGNRYRFGEMRYGWALAVRCRSALRRGKFCDGLVLARVREARVRNAQWSGLSGEDEDR